MTFWLGGGEVKVNCNGLRSNLPKLLSQVYFFILGAFSSTTCIIYIIICPDHTMLFAFFFFCAFSPPHSQEKKKILKESPKIVFPISLLHNFTSTCSNQNFISTINLILSSDHQWLLCLNIRATSLSSLWKFWATSNTINHAIFRKHKCHQLLLNYFENLVVNLDSHLFLFIPYMQYISGSYPFFL